MKKYIITAALSLFSIISLSAQSKKDAQVSNFIRTILPSNRL
jgi:hypothetical protein